MYTRHLPDEVEEGQGDRGGLRWKGGDVCMLEMRRGDACLSCHLPDEDAWEEQGDACSSLSLARRGGMGGGGRHTLDLIICETRWQWRREINLSPAENNCWGDNVGAALEVKMLEVGHGATTWEGGLGQQYWRGLEATMWEGGMKQRQNVRPFGVSV
ncbi:hypothetical protein BDQ17DRAFT_1332515 [Cyathus striatus]|nr:hypothetical protein BDQ17DRAFT_1332515 [Cyathus striatus]